MGKLSFFNFNERIKKEDALQHKNHLASQIQAKRDAETWARAKFLGVNTTNNL